MHPKLAFEEQIRHRLRRFERRLLREPVVRTAAVLMLLVRRNNSYSFILTKRTETVSTHKGQISFPGGGREEQDESLQATALRETYEEIGLESRHVEVIGPFHDYLSITGWRVVPFVGLLHEPVELVLNDAEVDRIVEVPFGFFTETLPRKEYRKKMGKTVPVYFYEYENDVIWGLTAAMIRDFVTVMAG